MTKIIIEDRMLLSDRRRVVKDLTLVITDLEGKGDFPVIEEQTSRLRKIVAEQERIIDEAGAKILRHMR